MGSDFSFPTILTEEKKKQLRQAIIKFEVQYENKCSELKETRSTLKDTRINLNKQIEREKNYSYMVQIKNKNLENEILAYKKRIAELEAGYITLQQTKNTVINTVHLPASYVNK